MLFCLFSLLCGVVFSDVASSLVHTSCGMIEGVESDTVTSYFGVPFAQPPIGKLRWQPPQPLKPQDTYDGRCWKDSVLHAKGNTPSCPQLNVLTGEVVGSEDCLYMNVFVPKENASVEKHPVLLWLFGGGLMIGAVSENATTLYALYGSPMSFAEEGYVVIAMNYRLSAAGWLTLPELSANDFRGKNVSGNYGLLDVLFVLEWIQKEIHAFGGDPSRVTVMGQSTGGTLVQALAVSPAAEGLFHAGVSLSASPRVAGTMEDAYGINLREFVLKTSCASVPRGEKLLSCLYDLEMSEMLNVMFADIHYMDLVDYFSIPKPSDPFINPLLVVDSTETMPRYFDDAFASGKFNWKNGEVYVFGVMREEIDLMPEEELTNYSKAQYDSYITTHLDAFGTGVGDAILKLYPYNELLSAQQGYDQIGSYVSTCQNFHIAANVAKYAPKSTFMYLGTQRPQVPFPGFIPHTELRYAFHAFDAVAAFGNSPMFSPVFHKEDFEFGKLTRSAILEAVSGSIKSVPWEPVGAKGMVMLLQTENTRSVENPMAIKCSYFDDHPNMFHRFGWVN